VPRARAKKNSGEPQGPSKAWLDSYADAMTLLLAFFILLYASSLIDEDKFIEFKLGVAQALGKPNPTVEGGLGILERGNGVATMVSAPPVITQNGDGSEGESVNEHDGTADEEFDEVTVDNAAEVADEIRRRIAEVGAEPFVDVVNDPRGVVIRLDSQVLFRSGEARVLPDGVIVLSQVSPVLLGIDNLMIVEGHTDNIPTGGTGWPTNWELSTARATTVLRYLVEVEDLPAVQISAAGYAETRPRASNGDAEGRARNRRVEIVVLISRDGDAVVTGASASDQASDPIVGDSFSDLLDLNPDPVPSSVGIGE
jgi:chemotaxis protein MotB